MAWLGRVARHDPQALAFPARPGSKSTLFVLVRAWHLWRWKITSAGAASAAYKSECGAAGAANLKASSPPDWLGAGVRESRGDLEVPENRRHRAAVFGVRRVAGLTFGAVRPRPEARG